MSYSRIPIWALLASQPNQASGQDVCTGIAALPSSHSKFTFARLSNADGFAQGSRCKINLANCYQPRMNRKEIVLRKCDYIIGPLVPDDASATECSFTVSYYTSADLTVTPSCTSTLSVTLGAETTPPQANDEDDDRQEQHPSIPDGGSVIHHCSPDGRICVDIMIPPIVHPTRPSDDDSSSNPSDDSHDGENRNPLPMPIPGLPDGSAEPQGGPIAELIASGCSILQAKQLMKASAYVHLVQICLSTTTDNASRSACIEERLAAMGFDPSTLACLGCWKTLMEAYVALPPADLETCVSDPMGHHCGDRMIRPLREFVSCSKVDLVSSMSLYVNADNPSSAPASFSSISTAIIALLIFLIHQ